MAWHPRGQDIYRHSEDHIHKHKTGTTMSSKVLPRCCLLGSPWRLAWHQRSSGSMPYNHSSCLIPIGVRRGIVRTIRKTFEKICKYWFKVVTVWRLISGNDHLYCGFGARRSHLTLHWMSAQGSVGFRWGTITGPYHANFSQVETQKFDPHWFYCLQRAVTTFFCQECMFDLIRDIAILIENYL